MEADPIGDRDLERAEARLPKWMIAIAGLATLVILAAGQTRTALGLALGATLAIVNYCWLHQAINTLFGTMNSRVPKRVLTKFVLRYPLAVLVIYLFYRAGRLPLEAIFAGLFVPVGGV